MRALLRRAIVALTLAPCLVLGPVMPQEHVHEGDVDHQSPVAHRHVAFHQHAGLHPSHALDHDAPEIGSHDEDAVWVDGVGLSQPAFHLSVAWVLVEHAAIATPDTASVTRRPDVDSSPPHGPPRPYFSLRGPPLVSA